MEETVEVYIRLLDEGIDVWRPTQAVRLNNHEYRILPTPDYDPEDEKWEYLPNEIVRCECKKLNDKDCLVAISHKADFRGSNLLENMPAIRYTGCGSS